MLELERRSMKMQLQSMSRKGFILIFGAFILLLVLSIIIGAAGPYVWSYRSLPTWICKELNPKEFDPATCKGVDLSQPDTYWIGAIHNLDKLNQQLTVTATLKNLVFGQKNSN